MTNLTASPAFHRPSRRPAADLPPLLRTVMASGGGVLSLTCLAALTRAATGLAFTPANAHELAVVVHLGTVLPAVPLGGYVLLAAKGTPRHRLLGKVWMALMLVAAASALFIRHLNHGGFSWLHLFVPLVLVSLWGAIRAARQGDIARHKIRLGALYVGALLIPGGFAFLPGRLMGQWLMG